MDGDGIFLRTGTGLVVLQRTLYESEAVLQEALAAYPEIIAGPSTSGDGQARLLLVRREMGIGTSDGAAGTFSLDHLFIDAAGVPVLVEVKRSTDTRIRREVIGQILDYAANGVRYWPLDALQRSLDRTAEEAGRSAEELIAELGTGLAPEEFWRTVETNLAAGRIRMLIVADALPAELVRIIEFLNEQMSPAEILGVEVRQFRRADDEAGEHVVYVPQVIGRTALAVAGKAVVQGSQWDRDSFLEAAAARCPDSEYRLACRLLDHAPKLVWGKGATPGVTAWYELDGQRCPVWYLNANDERPTSRAYLQLYLADIVKRTGAERVERASRILETVPPLKDKIAEARANDWRKYPSLYLGDAAHSQEYTESLLAALSSLAGRG
ncbi:MAG: hypothetical protein QOD41_1154 [Cryptosporangiaceae bacterium]|nr:hypothetical protein [Cryptosporangiaceae bacterium]